MNIVITGGTGFVGSHLTNRLTSEGHHVYILTRNPDQHRDTSQIHHVGWLKEQYDPIKHLPPIHGIVNLAGASLNSGRWTEKRKETILNSRLEATQAILKLIDNLEHKPEVLVNASAVGFYGNSQTKTFTEQTKQPGNDFLANVVTEWEHMASKAVQKGIRTVYVRFGIVLGKEGALPKMAIPYKLMVGGRLGSGEQWISWIHIHDATGIINFALKNHSIEGPINATTPHPKRSKDFGQTLSKALHRPHWLPAPAFVIKIALGDMSTLLLDGQAVLPKQALKHNYQFKYPNLYAALQSILNNEVRWGS